MLVPPLLTMLDDHEIKYRHQGVIALQLFLQKVPAILLARTGLDELIQRVRVCSWLWEAVSSLPPLSLSA